jgi:hypothetical protein
MRGECDVSSSAPKSAIEERQKEIPCVRTFLAALPRAMFGMPNERRPGHSWIEEQGGYAECSGISEFRMWRLRLGMGEKDGWEWTKVGIDTR